VETAALRITGIHGTGVAVIAAENTCATTGPVSTSIIEGTCVSVITSAFVTGKDAISVFADLICTAIAIVTGNGRSAEARAFFADVTGGAELPIVTRPGTIYVATSSIGFAAIHGAGIAVVTGQASTSQAGSVHAQVCSRTVILVVTLGAVVRKHAAQGGIAAIIGAWVSVVTCQGCGARLTASIGTGVAQGTTVRVVAGEGVWG
jgi:hypothetical protein